MLVKLKSLGEVLLHDARVGFTGDKKYLDFVEENAGKEIEVHKKSRTGLFYFSREIYFEKHQLLTEYEK